MSNWVSAATAFVGLIIVSKRPKMISNTMCFWNTAENSALYADVDIPFKMISD